MFRLLLALVLLSGWPAVAEEETPKTPGEKWLAAHQKPNPTRYYGEPVTLSLKDADLVEVLRSFAAIGDFNLVLQPSVQGKVTVELRDVPWDQALEQILKISNLGMEVTGGKVHVGPRSARNVRAQERSRALLTVSLDLRHADAEVVARALSRPQAGVPSAGGLIRAEGGRLVIRATRKTLRDFGRVLSYVDVPAAADEDPEGLAARCVELWDQLVPERPIARVRPREGG